MPTITIEEVKQNILLTRAEQAVFAALVAAAAAKAVQNAAA